MSKRKSKKVKTVSGSPVVHQRLVLATEDGETVAWRAFNERQQMDMTPKEKPPKPPTIGSEVTISRSPDHPNIPEACLGKWNVEDINPDGSYKLVRYASVQNVRDQLPRTPNREATNDSKE